jgi:hypothetical protein
VQALVFLESFPKRLIRITNAVDEATLKKFGNVTRESILF